MPLKLTKFTPNRCEAKVLKHLEKLYKNVERDVYLLHDNLLSYDSGVSFRPDFIILDPIYGISIIEVKSYTKKNLDRIQDNKIYFKDSNEPGISPFKKAQDYAYKLEAFIKSHGFKIDSKMIKTNLVFTNLAKDYFDDCTFVNLHYKNFKESLSLNSMFTSVPVDFLTIERMHKALNPITYFNTDEDLSLSDINAKIASLDQTQLDFVKKPIAGHYLISGIPGSGKSIAIISRALYISNEHPDWRILILSENKKLKAKNENALKTRSEPLKELGQNPIANIECKTLYGFLGNLSGLKHIKSMPYPKQLELMETTILNREIEPIYDAVLIDEYQDFTDEQLKIAKLICKKKEVTINKKPKLIENIFLAGDKLQKIKEKGGSHNWTELGFEVVGHSKNLKGSYRCGRDILDLALSFLMTGSKTLEKEVHTYYEGIDNIEYLSQFESKITSYTGWLDLGISKLKQWVDSLIKNGVSPSEIIIITPNNKKQKKEIEDVFSKELTLGLTVGMPSTVKGLEASFCALYNFGSFGYHQESKDNKYKEIYMCLTRSRVGLFVHCCKADNPEFQKLCELMELKGIGEDEAA